MTVRDALRHGAALLAAACGDTPRLDARLLLAQATGLSQAALLQNPDRTVDIHAYQALLDRRAAHEPVALILGRAEFWSMPFAVSPATLIPRPDTETLVEAALAAVRRASVHTVLDLGTGTGCLLLAALSELPCAWGLGVDRVPAAAALAQANARALGLHGRSAILCADWATPVAARFDLVLSNPPYIERAAISGLIPDVAAYEPPSALDGGADGLDAYRTLAAALPRLLMPGGVAVLELGQGQAAPASALAVSAGLRVDSIRPDLAGIPRALVLRPA